MSIRILLAEDTQMVSDAFVALLKTEPDFEIVATLPDGRGVVEEAKRAKPDICILDIDMPVVNGLDAARALRAEFPTMRIMLLTALPGSGHLSEGVSIGINGYVRKTDHSDRLLEAIRKIAAGEDVIDHNLALTAIKTGPNPLTERERGILLLVGEGLSARSIGEKVNLNPGTVRNYMSTIITKLGAKSRGEAYQKAVAEGWIQPKHYVA